MKPLHIVLIRLSAMGDVAMVVPVLRAFLGAHPNVRVTVVTKKHFAPIFKSLDVQTIGVDPKQVHKGLYGIWRLARQVRKLQPDIVLDLHQVLRSKLLRFFIGVPSYSLDKNRAAKKALTNPNRKELKPLPSVFEMYQAVFIKAGFEFSLENAVIPPKPPLTNGRITATKPWIGVAPFAQHSSKEISIDSLKQLVKMLLEKHGVTLLLFAGPSEHTKLMPLILDSKRVISVPSLKMPFEEELDYIAHLDSMVGMDSGNGHLAAMFGIPTITLWGVTHPFAGFKPFMQPLENSFLADRSRYPLIPTSIYGNQYPPEYERAIESIDMLAVADRVIQLLGADFLSGKVK